MTAAESPADENPSPFQRETPTANSEAKMQKNPTALKNF